jgi:hypothetical protein
MSIITNQKKTLTSALGAAAAAVVAPALLLSGAGTAQAATTVNTASDAVGVTVTINSDGVQHGWCTYTATPAFTPGSVKPLPVYNVPFFLQPGQSHNLWFPGIQTGTTWKATVSCEHGGTQVNWPIY